MRHVAPTTLITALLPVMLSGCSDGQKGRAPSATAVETITIRPEDVPNILELSGRIQAVRTAEVRARTDGIVQRRLFEEGSIVAAGTPLFEIDPRDYRAQVQQAQGTLQRAEALRDNAQSVVHRYDPLIADRAVSRQEYDAARSDLAQAQGQVVEGKAALDRSRLQLGFTTVRAPIAGRVGRAEVTEGALVSGGQASLMTRIDQITPVYAVFSQSNAAILDLVQKARAGSIKLPSPKSVSVRLILENGTEYPVAGRIDFTGTNVDPATGSQTIRAQMPNAQQLLAPGQFVRGRIEAGTIASGITIPARAVQFKGEQASVSVLGADGTVINRPVTLGTLLGERWIVQSGLKAGERVIVEGWQKVRPGQKARDAASSQPAKATSTAKGR
ncbi:efflux RND transporter periplasmic adaptor subunit [Sphingobium sp. BHU LFT2]|uniref:efflux RND transporter periplasmic adaptor subunit n=1 Tax=Sphingobium sp. BHU LFT2 TaxID=2807634 RepID=UPI002035B69B|nr:efflux RND transporter periplasmic adaptor subunit [Sphingobium sp. BHU LFT2]